MDSLAKVTESDEFSAIGEPDFDFESIDLPDEGEFKYQFKIEVRPEFKTPDWKGLELKKPVEEIGDEDVEKATTRILTRYATLEATDEPAEPGDTLLITAVFKDGETLLSDMDEERVTLSTRLSLPDGIAETFGDVMAGVVEDETRTVPVKLSETHDNEELRGKTIEAHVHVVEVLRSEFPDLTAKFLDELGEFESEEELKDFVRSSLERQAQARTDQSLRSQIVDKLAGDVNFDLPAELVRKQTRREMERKMLEFRRSGFDDDMIRRFVNSNRQNLQAGTEASLREHFILEQIADEAKVDAEANDYNTEIDLIAEQSDQSPRSVRARLEKSGQMDALRNQIVERKVIEMIVAAANVTDEKIKPGETAEHEEYAIDHEVVPVKQTDSIPEAKYDDVKKQKGEEEDK